MMNNNDENAFWLSSNILHGVSPFCYFLEADTCHRLHDINVLQEAHHPIATEGTPSVARLNSMNSIHRRRRSGSGAGALMDMNRADPDAIAASAAETSPQPSRSLLHKYASSFA